MCAVRPAELLGAVVLEASPEVELAPLTIVLQASLQQLGFTREREDACVARAATSPTLRPTGDAVARAGHFLLES